MTKKIIASKYDYDFQNDSLFFYIKGKKYKSSIEFDGIILDFDEKDKDIMSLEILNASEKFNISKSDLLTFKHFNAHVVINEESIKVTMKLDLLKRNKVFPKCAEALTANVLKLPSSTQGIVATC